MMKKNWLHRFTLALFITGWACGCQKEERLIYKDVPRIYIYKNTLAYAYDSLNYSFAVKNSARVRDTVWATVRIMGDAISKDRVIEFRPVDSLTTAVEGRDYELMKYIMPSDSFTTRLGIIIRKTPEMDVKTLKLVMKLMPSRDFQTGIYDQLFYRVVISNILVKPNDWDSWLKNYFGSYSERKYRFIIDVLGIAEFTDAMSYSEYGYFAQRMKNALADYETKNGPMIDENGNRVVF